MDEESTYRMRLTNIMTRLTIFLSIILFSLLILPPERVHAVTFSTSTAADLIAAINTANGNGVADTIVLTADISLVAIDNVTNGNNGLPIITSDITIEGNGFSIRRTAGACGGTNFRIFYVETTGTLSLFNVGVERGCAATGFYPNGAGGGIFNAGTISTISYSTIANNTANYIGGGIFNANGASIGLITNTTFSGNNTDEATPFLTGGGGGAIFNLNGTITTIQNTTFSGNIADDSSTGRAGGAIFNTGAAGSIGTIANVTMTNNSASMGGGAIENSSTIGSITNTLVVNNNLSNTGGNCTQLPAMTPGGADNLADDNTCGSFSVGTMALLALASNGGPTQTAAIATASDADDTGGGGCLSIDQRGLVRPNAGGVCDVGAYELGTAIFVTPTVEFQSLLSAGLEGTIHNVTLVLNVGAVDIGDNVNVTIQDLLTGTATSGADYTAILPTTVTFICTPAAPCTGTVTMTFPITITDDSPTVDPGETINLNILSVTGPAEIGIQTLHTVLIQEQLTLMVAGAGTGNGTMTDNIPGGTINCTSTASVTAGDCDETVSTNPDFQVVATADPGSVFIGWIGCDATSGANGEICDIRLASINPLITATFAEEVTLTVLGTGAGNGSVTDTTPGGTINCTSTAGVTSVDCTEDGYNQNFIMTAVADVGFAFSSWTGCDVVSGVNGEICDITLTTIDTNVTATFAELVTLTVLGAGDGNGSMTDAPTTISCTSIVSVTAGDCTEDGYNLNFTITAVADPGFFFTGWIACNSVSGANGEICNITLTTIDATVTATFSTVPPIIGTGSSASSPSSFQVIDPAISKIGYLQPGQTGVLGEQIVWVISVQNTGNVPLTNVIVTDTLIPALQIDSVDAPGAIVNISGQTVTVTYAILNIGETRSFTITTTVLAGVEISNLACVTSINGEFCVTGVLIQELPRTGDTPPLMIQLRYLLIAGLIAIMTFRFRFYIARKQRFQNTTSQK